MDFPKEYKVTLGQDVKRDALQRVSSICRASKAAHKKEHLEAFSDEFELLKLEIRLCADMKVLSFKKQAELSVLMDSIGKQRLPAGGMPASKTPELPWSGWRQASSFV